MGGDEGGLSGNANIQSLLNRFADPDTHTQQAYVAKSPLLNDGANSGGTTIIVNGTIGTLIGTASFIPQPVNDGIFNPQVGIHAIVDGRIIDVTGDGKIAFFRQDIFPGVINEVFINIVCILRLKLL